MASKYVKMEGTIGKTKRFSEKLLKKYDEPLRIKLKKILGDFIKDNDDIYAQDFIITDPECKYKYLEVQVVSKWLETYPYKNVYLYERKLRYGSDTLYLTVSSNFMNGFLFAIPDKEKKKLKPRRFKKYSRMFVYDVPWKLISRVYIDHLDDITFNWYGR